jgi:two-component system chemotaxis response regulator CheB
LEPRPQCHDVIVIGGSAGSLEALQQLMRDLPADLPAAVFIVMHVGATSYLAHFLRRNAAIQVKRAEAGERIEWGCVYVAPPGNHLLLHDRHVLLRRGPRENMSRPAIDPLFRSAAATFGGRVIGVIVSGALSDGSAGLRAVKRCGGVAVVQDPHDAAVDEMPRNAMARVEVDHVVASADMAGLLTRLTHQEAGPTPEISVDIKLEAAIAAQELGDMPIEERLGNVSPFTCPECHGALWEIANGDMLRYRCHVGHAYSADAILAAQADEVERLLRSLLRSHQERAALAGRAAEAERLNGRAKLASARSRVPAGRCAGARASAGAWQQRVRPGIRRPQPEPRGSR